VEEIGATANDNVVQKRGVVMTEPKSHFYEVEVEWASERQGILRALNLPSVQVDAPPEFKGHAGNWTPEHLFVASVNTCFLMTFLAIAGNSRLEFVSFSSTARGKLERVEGPGYQITEIEIRPRVVLRSGGDLGRTARILEKAEKGCLISNSIKTAVKVEPEIYVSQTPVSPCPPKSSLLAAG
jgi:organic hydroperoxide reductase OsmC/OhrA